MADAPSRVPGQSTSCLLELVSSSFACTQWVAVDALRLAAPPELTQSCAPLTHSTLTPPLRSLTAQAAGSQASPPRLNSCSLAARANCKPRRRLHDETLMDTVSISSDLGSPVRRVAPIHPPASPPAFTLPASLPSRRPPCLKVKFNAQALRWWRWTLRLSRWLVPELEQTNSQLRLGCERNVALQMPESGADSKRSAPLALPTGP
ncbi:hypothetical protein B0H14DRAFT_3888052 [Mycena olivaceomarginata]|nr:hypothetical protein B0H14DRAFT_3888052 [Mycena olivaceomarginata]